MTLRWLEPGPVSVSQELRAAIGGHPLVAETLVRRGMRTVAEAQAFLNADLYVPAVPEDMPGMVDAVGRIQRALDSQERILVWGDFDVDGQTATTLLVSCLQDLGGDVAYHIPIRDTESHGMRVPWLAEELARGIGLVVTCDTGIDAHEAVTYAHSCGVDVIITDHHELPSELPEAVAVINPHRLPEDHPLASLPGVGVAYKVAEALYVQVGRAESASALLDLVALGIVADVAVQTGDTRYLLQRGLQVLRETPRIGLQALMKLAKIAPATLTTEDIGFGVGPRMNALGRLGDANAIVELLTTHDLSRARILASQLESLNLRRRSLCDQVMAGAEAQLERDPALLESAALVLGDPDWPAGVIGIVANRLVERYQRPVVMLSTPPGEMARGSARSVDGCHITEAIATQAELLEGFGGHKMAAGMSLDRENIDAFRQGLSEAVAGQLIAAPVEPSLEVHGFVTLGELSVDLVTDLRRLAPFGAGNPPLVLVVPDARVVDTRTLGKAGRHLKITVEDSDGTRRNVLRWNWDGEPLPEGAFDVAFTIGLNHYRGNTDVQLVWEGARPARSADIGVASFLTVDVVELVDYRGTADPQDAIGELAREGGSVEVWLEGKSDAYVMGHHRLSVEPSETLVIWQAPPGPGVLRAVYRRVAPRRVVVVARDSELDRPSVFVRYLMGLIKHALKHREGKVSVPELAAAMGQREAAVRAGLDYLIGRGVLSVVYEGDTFLQLAAGGEDDANGQMRARAQLAQILEDTVAYRRSFARATVAQLRTQLQVGDD